MPTWIIALIVAMSSANDGNNVQCNYVFEPASAGYVSETVMRTGYNYTDCAGDVPSVETLDTQEWLALLTLLGWTYTDEQGTVHNDSCVIIENSASCVELYGRDGVWREIYVMYIVRDGDSYRIVKQYREIAFE